jgi:hypothetical protein
MAHQSVRPVAHLRENPDGSWAEHDLKEHLMQVADKVGTAASYHSTVEL